MPSASLSSNTTRILIPLLLASTFTGILSSCVASSKKYQLTLQEHPLVGRIWDVGRQKFINKASLVERMGKAEYLLLGERHDNLVHHEHQTWFIQQLRRKQKQVSVAFEMIDNYQGERLARQRITSTRQMIKVLDQFRTNWQYKTRYQALFSEVIAAGYHIDAANLNRERLRHTVRQGENKLPHAYKRMLDEVPFSSAQLSNLKEEIKASHCHLLDDKTSEKMVLGQRVRDVIMTQSLLKSQSPIKVLIAGAGHVRNDRGVPLYLGKNRKVLSVGFMEVEHSVNEVTPYAKPWGTEPLPFDIVWFTPRVVRKDLCKQLKQQLKGKTATSFGNGKKGSE